MTREFSARTRVEALAAMAREEFDLLVVGGGITGAAVARDACMRGMKVALVERSDFASGTSSRSSKLIHGGLRYLENLEFRLVFEALSERALLLRTVPHMVRPLPFYFPIYRGDAHGRLIIGLGMFLYDLLALFRTPGYHRRLSARAMLSEIPGLRAEGLRGGFQYYDASMWDDMLVIELLRDAIARGVRVASYTEALEPLRGADPEGPVTGFRVRDLRDARALPVEVRARQVVVCAGPWTDELGRRLSPSWKPWLKPSKGTHIVFDLARFRLPGAMVMSHPSDGRISFVIPRPDLGSGVTIVGTTDGPAPADPARVEVSSDEVDYLLQLMDRYFRDLRITRKDILSAYVGIRPLVGNDEENAVVGGNPLAKVSREHEIITGPGGAILVGGGKYTTHRKMAEEIVDYALAEARKRGLRSDWGPAATEVPPNPAALGPAVVEALASLEKQGMPTEAAAGLVSRYGAEGLEVVRLDREARLASEGEALPKDPPGFPCLAGQLLFHLRHGGVMQLEDFWFRRVPLFLARADHGLPWAEALSRLWARELGLDEAARDAGLGALRQAVARARRGWSGPG